MEPQKNVLIVGATGGTGRATVDELLARGHRVTLFNRGKTNADLFPELETIIGDRDPDVGAGLGGLAGRKWDAVIDNSGYVPRMVAASSGLLAPSVGLAWQGSYQVTEPTDLGSDDRSRWTIAATLDVPLVAPTRYARIREQRSAVRRSCQTIALCTGRPS